jgi:phytanoyl-CoA hydroxylase
MREKVLNPDGTLQSELWLDQPDAHQKVANRLADAEISSEEADNLNLFIDRGYMIFDLDITESIIDNIRTTVDLLWNARPQDLLVACGAEKTRPFSEVPDELGRRPGIRFIDFHSHCEGARQLYLNKKLHRYCELIYGQRPVATQTLYFEYGSQQSLHRDPWYVVTNPPCNLLASWIALEDITADSGPLTYVPGSHRLPYYKMSNGDIISHAPNVTKDDVKKTYEHMSDMIDKYQLKPQHFLAKKGQVFIWHSSLVHGGSPVSNPLKTRNSLVVHYDVAAYHLSHAQWVNTSKQERFITRTQRLMFQDGCIGFDNPVRLYDFNIPR